MKTLLLLLLTLIGPVASAADFNVVDAAKSSLAFTYRQMGVSVDGRFGKFAVSMDFDPARPAAAKAAIDVDLASIDTGSPEGDDEVAGKSWFDSKTYPVARFVSTAVKPLGGNRFDLSGKLTLKGRTKDVNAQFTYAPQGVSAVFDGAIAIKRGDFAIGEGEWADFGTVANEVQIKFHILAAASK
jgi:polyisoprenoid-binding protein YceI